MKELTIMDHLAHSTDLTAKQIQKILCTDEGREIINETGLSFMSAKFGQAPQFVGTPKKNTMAKKEAGKSSRAMADQIIITWPMDHDAKYQLSRVRYGRRYEKSLECIRPGLIVLCGLALQHFLLSDAKALTSKDDLRWAKLFRRYGPCEVVDDVGYYHDLIMGEFQTFDGRALWFGILVLLLKAYRRHSVVFSAVIA
jgi:hypothetical protein